MTDKELLQQALEALVESVDLVSNAYETDWRHGLPTRKAQLDVMKAGVAFHEATIAALRERLARQEQNPGGMEEWQALALRAGWRMPARQEYPEGDVVGPCICESWPGGKCLKCPRIEPARQEQEPVAWMNAGHEHELRQKRIPYVYAYPVEGAGAHVPLYTAPPARQWQGLTDEEITQVMTGNGPNLIHFARAIEQRLKEKNT